MDPGVECVAVVVVAVIPYRVAEWPPLCAHNWDIHLMVILYLLEKLSL